ncbi:alpha-L-fucosidase [Parabacteroides sp.]|uniref:alpha-L-fucosidase n=1 Tax=Parabacteroides sp. TaxID=1869337 RepID=UPI00308095C7
MEMKNMLILGLCACSLLACQEVAPPAPVLPVPTPEQIEWQKMENYAFVHFGLNTFNDLEWGYGNTPAETFDPTDLDCEQWVRVIQAAGLKGVILTAKHHDGFCLWPTKTVDYNISHSPYKEGKGDMVRELSDACKKYGLKFGLYLSPWDRHNAEYGQEGYQKTYHEQINELISNYGPLFEFWFDGANGGNGWYGGADESRSINPKEYYGYEIARQMIKAKHPGAMIFGGTVPDIRWIGNESGWAGETNWAPYSLEKETHYTQNQWGMKDGNQWLPGECDVSIRPGWFYHHREDHQVRTVPNLVDLYYRSVGHNANFLLNFPVALNGQIHSVDSARAVDWSHAIKAELNKNLLEGIRAKASEERGSAYRSTNTTDDNWDSYWATSDGVTTGTLTFPLPAGTLLNRVLIQEYIPLGQRVCSFTLDVEKDGKWQPVETTDTLSTIGYKRIVRFKTTEADALRISFTEAKGPLCINNVEAFQAPPLLEQPMIVRNAQNEVSIRVESEGVDMYYTTDGSEPTVQSAKYKAPFSLDKKGTVKAVTYDPQSGKTGPVGIRYFDLPASDYNVLNPTDDHTALLFDGNGYSTCYLPEGKNELVIKLRDPHVIKGFVYTPNQGRDANGHISDYQLLVDGKVVASGEFSNIKHNPIEQEIRFEPVRGQNLVFKATRIVDNAKRVGIAEFSVITED